MAMSVISVVDGEEVFSSPSLQQICIRFCIDNTKTLFLSPASSKEAAGKGRKRKGQDWVRLPKEVWEDLLTNFDSFSENYLPLVQAVHSNVPSLRKIHVRNSLDLKDGDLEVLLARYPVSLDIHNCPSLTKKAVDVINQFGRDLKCLIIGTSTQIIPTNVDNWMANHKTKDDDDRSIRKLAKSVGRFFRGKFTAGSSNPKDSFTTPPPKPSGMLTLPKLRKLVIWGHHVIQVQQVRRRNVDPNQPEAGVGTEGGGDSSAKVPVDYWEYLTRDFIHSLQYLDLSSVQEVADLGFLLPARHSLLHLHLHDVLLDYDPNTWGVLRSFSRLRFLDVSQYNELASVFANPDLILHQLVAALPKLEGLDISGTNLAGIDPDPSRALVSPSLPGILGLASRMEIPLKFLGLLSTQYNGSGRPNLPVIPGGVAGGDSIPQLLLAMKVYLHRDNILRKAVRILHERLTTPKTDPPEFIPAFTILEQLLEVMQCHMEDKHGLIVSMAALFFILKRIYSQSEQSGKYLSDLRTAAVFNLVSRSMTIHCHELSLLRNGVLITLLIFPHLQITVSVATKLVPCLLQAGITSVSSGTADSFLTKAVSHMLHTVTTAEDPSLMEKLMESKIPEQLCVLLEEMFNKRIYDHMSVCWLILQKFLRSLSNASGDARRIYHRFASVQIIEPCVKLVKFCSEDRTEFEVEEELIAERKNLQELQKPVIAFLTNLLYHATPTGQELIVKSEYVKPLYSVLVNTDQRDDQLLHVVCGFLAHVVSHPESWKLSDPSREAILSAIYRVMSQMEFDDKFSFTFKNLSQLYELLKTPDLEVHFWVLWTLLKLAQADLKRLLNMIVQDGKLNFQALHLQYSASSVPKEEYGIYGRLEALRSLLSELVDEYNAAITSLLK